MDNSDSDDYELMPSHELDDLRHEVSSMKKNSMAEGDKARMLIESMDRLTVSINKFTSILNDAQKDIIDEYQASKPTEKLNQLLDQSETIAKALIAMNENLTNSNNARNAQPASNPTPTPTPAVDYSTLAYSSPATNYNPAQPYTSTTPSNFNSPANYSQAPTQNFNAPGTNYNPGQNYSQTPNQNYPSQNAYSQGSSFNNMPPMTQQNVGVTNNSRNVVPIPIPFSPGSQSTGSTSMNQQPTFGNALSMDNPSRSISDDFPPMEDIPPLEGPTPSVPKKKFLGIM
jgi:hypothetical protein